MALVALLLAVVSIAQSLVIRRLLNVQRADRKSLRESWEECRVERIARLEAEFRLLKGKS